MWKILKNSNIRIQKKQKGSDGDTDSQKSEDHTETNGSGNVGGISLNNSQQPESSEEPGGINLNNSQKPESSEDDEKGIGHQPEIRDGGIGSDYSRLSKRNQEQIL